MKVPYEIERDQEKHKKTLDKSKLRVNFVNAMNNNLLQSGDQLLQYQVNRLQNLISEVVACCDDRKLYESKRFELPYAELKCLMLFQGERYLTVKQIAMLLEVAKSRVTKLINSLEGKGFVERVMDPQDARMKLISLTPMGHHMMEKINMFQKDLHQQILLQFSEEERKKVLSNMELLRAAMESVKGSLM
jgi:DNA-binding MarR family transcriptional regulator